VSESDPPPATVCPLCAVGCRLRPGAGPESGSGSESESDSGSGSRARGVAGPANPEGRLCRKGVGAFDVERGDDRLRQPTVRRDGDHVSVPWPEAVDAAAEALTRVRAAHGADAVAFLGAPHCTNEENYLLQRLARAFGTNNVDNRARLCHESAARTLADRVGWPASTGSLSDLRAADVIVVAGANPAERQPVAFNSFVRPAVRDGTTLVHVDPVGNRTTRLADVHLAPHPGADRAVFDLLCARLLAADRGVDRAFVAERTRGFEAFAASAAAFDTADATAAAGVDPDATARVVDAIAEADRVAALTGTGVDGTDAVAPGGLLNLLLLTGNMGRPGSGWYVLRGLANEQGAVDAGCAPDRLPGHQPVTDPQARDRVSAVWRHSIPETPGKTARESLAAFGEEVRGALVVGENPAVSKRDREWVRDRLDALDALVVSELYPNETTARADVVFPAAAGVEKAGTITNLERRVQRLRPAATPPGNARPDFAILRALGRRVVGPGQFDYPNPAAAFDELARVAPTHAGGRYDSLGDDGRQWPFGDDGPLYEESFDTADGRARFGRLRPVSGSEDLGDRLHLVTGGRCGGLTAEPVANTVVRVNPADADDRGLGAGDVVRIGADGPRVTATVALDEGTRRGAVYLPAVVADPLLRAGVSTVTLEGVPGDD
jgi:formate dehydrogenase major subunit